MTADIKFDMEQEVIPKRLTYVHKNAPTQKELDNGLRILQSISSEDLTLLLQNGFTVKDIIKLVGNEKTVTYILEHKDECMIALETYLK